MLYGLYPRVEGLFKSKRRLWLRERDLQGSLTVMLCRDSSPVSQHAEYALDDVSAFVSLAVERIGRPPLKSYAVARRKMKLCVEHRQHKGLDNRSENSHKLMRRHEWITKQFNLP
jgi:hypothetical protein